MISGERVLEGKGMAEKGFKVGAAAAAAMVDAGESVKVTGEGFRV